ncbi:hypothetical protein D3C77_535480 [compost metagenome]
MPAAQALARVQPVPCVWRVSTRSLSSTVSPSAVSSRSITVAPGTWPPFISTARAPMFSRASPARRWPSRSATVSPVSASASGALGVSKAARGTISRRTASTARSSSRGEPPLAIMTGSTTAGTPAA